MIPPTKLPDVTGDDLAGCDIPALARALMAEGLPTEDLAGDAKTFLAFRDRKGALVGFAGAELFGATALLRSVVVLPTARGKAYGSAIVEWMVKYAVAQGVRSIFLLTTTAAPFFRKRGFRHVDRDEAPRPIASTREFASLCPSTAVFMRRDVDAS